MREYLIVASGADPVSITEAKAYLKIADGDTAQDDLLRLMIRAARGQIEAYTGVSLADQTVVFRTNEKLVRIPAPLAPVGTIETVLGIDSRGGETELDETKVELDGGDVDNRYFMLRDLGIDGYNYLIINYTADAIDTEPALSALKMAVLRQVTWLYDHRDDIEVGSITPLTTDVRALIAPYRFITL